MDKGGEGKIATFEPRHVYPLEFGGSDDTLIEDDVEVGVEERRQTDGSEGTADAGGVPQSKVEVVATEAVDGAGDNTAA